MSFASVAVVISLKTSEGSSAQDDRIQHSTKFRDMAQRCMHVPYCAKTRDAWEGFLK